MCGYDTWTRRTTTGQEMEISGVGPFPRPTYSLIARATRPMSTAKSQTASNPSASNPSTTIEGVIPAGNCPNSTGLGTATLHLNRLRSSTDHVVAPMAPDGHVVRQTPQSTHWSGLYRAFLALTRIA